MSVADSQQPVPYWLRFFRRCRSVLWTAIFLVTVALAIVVGLGRALTPYANQLKPAIEERLSQELGLPVRIHELTAQWQGLDPYFDLQQVQVGNAAEQGLSLEQLRLRMHLLHWLLPRRDDWSLEISGVDLHLLRDDDGQWQVQGFVNGEETANDYRTLLQLGDITINNSHLHLLGVPNPQQLLVNSVRLRQQQQGLTLNGTLGLQDSTPLQLKARFTEIDNQAQWQVYIQAQEQPLGTWLSLSLPSEDASSPTTPMPGSADVELWLDWHENQQTRASAYLSLNRPLFTGPDNEPLESSHTQAQLWFDAQGDTWQLDVTKLNTERVASQGLMQRAADAFTFGDGPLHDLDDTDETWLWVSSAEHTEFGLANLDLAMISELAYWWPQAPEFLREAAFQGAIPELTGRWDSEQGLAQLDGRWQDLSLASVDGVPGTESVSGQIRFRHGLGQVEMADGQLLVPSVFPNPLPLQTLKLQFEVNASEQGTQILFPQLDWDSDGLELKARGRYVTGNESQGHAPWLEMDIAIAELKVEDTDTYLPARVMGQRTGEWLQRGLLSGQLEDIRATFRGDPGQWPFAAGQGVFRATSRVRGVDVQFNDDWPVIRQLDGQLSFSPKEMFIDDATVGFAGAPVQALNAYIADMDDAVLELTMDSRTDASNHLTMLGRLPLQAGAWVETTDLSLSGPSRIRADLSVDFRDGRSDAWVDGVAEFLDVSANYNDRLKLSALKGDLKFSNDGLEPADLTVRWRKQAGQLSFAQEPFSVALSGRFDVQEVLDVAGVDTLWQQYLQGDSLWHWHLMPASSGSYLQAESDLIGVNVSLPDPLTKLPFMPQKLQVTVPFGDEIPVHVRYGGEVDAMVRLDEESRVNGVNLMLTGACDSNADTTVSCWTSAPALPWQGWLGGYASKADLLSWVDVIEALAAVEGEAEQSLEWRGNARFKQMQLMGRFFTDADMNFARNGEHWGVGFGGEQLQGKVRLPAGDNASNTIVAEFDYLYLPPPPSVTVAAAYTDPQNMPALHLYAEDLHWEAWPVGEIQVQAFPVATGLRFETIEASNSVFNLSGQGEWLREGNDVHSNLQLRFDAEQLGALLETLGYGAVVEGGQTIIELAGRWPGGPSDFALAKLSGSLDVNVVQGRFPEAGPGAGRMLGLMSVQALPRRILLDFRDVFETGLNFDRLHGAFQIADGFATTDDLEIDSTAATILVNGRTDLVKKEYDQTVSIRPGVGSTLPVIGAIAGGPVGVTAGLALQGLLSKPLGGLAEVTYYVSGPWDDPQVEDQPLDAERTPDSEPVPILPPLPPGPDTGEGEE